MNELTKTMTFVGAAAVMAVVAVGSHFMNRPTNSADFELVGKPFFIDFDSASQAQSLEVVAMDPETARLKRFSVENQDGLWRIPSHSDYPAEAAARLATTATSVMGLERESLAGRLVKEHERLGVVDPLGDDVEDPEATGKRITLKDAGGEVVVDYIIGKEAGDVVLSSIEEPFGQQGDEKYYYVRRPDENQTYKVKLDIDLSTKFSDWIDPDLLRVESNELTKVVINNYSIQEERTALGQTQAMFKQQGDVLNLTRATPTDSWMLEGLKEATEELTTDRVDKIVGVLDELKIAGVRPKFKYKDSLLLTADLKLNSKPEFEANPREFGAAIDQLQDELDQKGFNLAGSEKKLELVSKYGELTIGTDKGVQYTLHIGNPVEGDETEIEIGSSSSSPATKEDSDQKLDDESSAEGAKTGEQTSGENEPATEENEDVEVDNRYLLVRVGLDRSLINPQPEKPTEPSVPVAPEGYQPPPAEPEASEDAEAPEGVDPPEGEDEEEAPTKQEREPEFVKHDEALKAFEAAKVQYELDLTRFEDDTKAFEEKVAESQKLVDELNERFADWYYVMSADNLNTLRTERADLVTLKQPEPGSEPPPAVRPDISFPDLPIGDGVGGADDQPPMKEDDLESDPPQSNNSSQEESAQQPKQTTDKEPAAESVEAKPETEASSTEAPSTEASGAEASSTETPSAEASSTEASEVGDSQVEAQPEPVETK